MKEMKKIAEGKNFTACDFGKLNDLGGYVLQLGDIKIPGKVFGGQAVGDTGMEVWHKIDEYGQYIYQSCSWRPLLWSCAFAFFTELDAG